MVPGNALTPRPTAPRPQTADVRRFAFELPAHAEAVARARHLVEERLLLWEIAAEICDAVTLVVSELFTNAVVHTMSGRVVCELRDGGERLRVAVQDEGCPASGPRLSRSCPEEGGRGLMLVDAVSSAWGAHEARHGAGRVVWAELPHDTAGPC
ncbi:ATP-binding protein [Streptomyces sp. LP05-1]|uniref:ATP-binding protein n=1 Tax=Streptomyces pyxinae TaxID=2970734 RepID=A0ABT2CKW4_9ACTN|nr:ATP-binding protein [Streptomyces sp. LP05-1]MCS0637950.1 ATP-binding protein [Streptomyces sp. LP05-1]